MGSITTKLLSKDRKQKEMGKDYAGLIAKRALELGAIKLQPQEPFKWASGFFMPIYNDNRMLLGSAKDRALVAEGFRDILKQKRIRADMIGGTSTAGIAPGTTLADLLQKPFIYG